MAKKYLLLLSSHYFSKLLVVWVPLWVANHHHRRYVVPLDQDQDQGSSQKLSSKEEAFKNIAACAEESQQHNLAQ